MCIAFSLAFLIPLLTVALSPWSAPWVVGAGAAVAIESARRRRPRMAVAIAAGLAVFGWCGPTADQRPDVAPRSVQLTVTGIIEGSPRRAGARKIIALAGGLELALPGNRHAPLPGTSVRARGRLDPGGRVVRIARPQHLIVLAEAPWWHFGAWTERARRSIRHRLGVGAPPRTAAALRTLVLGDPLPRAHRKALARTGTLHFFAVSGLHLSLIAAMLARCVGPRGRWILPALVTYAAITGLRTPVSRALIMVAGLIGARAHRRPFRPLPQLLLAATILLALDPESLGTPGFALSFCAYGGIVLIALPALDRRRGDPLGPLERGLGARLPWSEHLIAAGWVSGAAFVASAPATAWFFHRITPAGLPGSILIAPAIPVLILCAAALVVVPGCPPVLAIADAALGVLDFLIACLDRMPGGSWTVSRPHALALLVSGAGSLWLAWVARRGQVPRHGLLVMIAATAALAIPRSLPPPGAYLIPAGRGSALLVRSADEIVLIDAGPKEARVASALLDRGVRHLDGLVITHAHEDHAGGRDEVRERLHVEREGPTASGARLLWPPSNDQRFGTNDLSAVLRFEGAHHRLLITGDIETAGTRALLAARDDLDADILVLPHHGARNDALADLIRRSLPDRCWLPARAGFPSETSMLTLIWLGLAAEPTWRTGTAPPSLVEWPYRERE